MFATPSLLARRPTRLPTAVAGHAVVPRHGLPTVTVDWPVIVRWVMAWPYKLAAIPDCGHKDSDKRTGHYDYGEDSAESAASAMPGRHDDLTIAVTSMVVIGLVRKLTTYTYISKVLLILWPIISEGQRFVDGEVRPTFRTSLTAAAAE